MRKRRASSVALLLCRTPVDGCLRVAGISGFGQLKTFGRDLKIPRKQLRAGGRIMVGFQFVDESIQ
jgi:hypothetical protein